jgi:hypothetical protein
MKTAILLIGELRTVDKTIDIIRENIVNNLDCDVFCVFNGTGRENEIEQYEKLINEKLGDKCKSVKKFLSYDEIYLNYKNLTLNNLKNKLPNNWINYIGNSGCIIQHYQIWLCYKSMVNYEMINNIKYDYVLKFRIDMIWNENFNLNWIYNIEEEIKKRIKIYIENKKEINNEELIARVMATIFSDKQIVNMLEDKVHDYYSEKEEYINKNDVFISKLLNLDKNSDEFIKIFKQFILSGRYILTFRKDLIYFTSRNYFTFIASLGLTYCEHGFYNNQNTYWFNSESQLSEISKEIGLSYFNYSTNIDDRTLCDHNYSTEVLNNPDPKLLYSVIRK